MIKKVVVVGAGTMGAGIAQVVAEAGYDVVLGDINEEFVQRGFGIINKSLGKMVEKGKMEAGRPAEITAKIKGVVNVQDTAEVADADLVIEAIAENDGLEADAVPGAGQGLPGPRPSWRRTPPA